jgi:hypothetical protein
VASTITEPIPSIPRTENIGDSSYIRSLSSRLFLAGESLSGNERNKLYLNDGKASFTDVSDVSGADSPEDGRAVLAADFDSDGDIDLFVHNSQLERHRYYENQSTRKGAFLKVRLRTSVGHYEAIGSEVTLVSDGGQVTQLMARGNGFLSCNPPELIFGLPAKGAYSLRVRWPTGSTEVFDALSANTLTTFVQGTGRTETMRP